VTPLLQQTDAGLYCAAGDFHIDPWRPVPRAVITHAHSDHARSGMGAYLCAAEGMEVLRIRVGAGAAIQGAAWGERITMGDTVVSLHPAGHILGSAQVRVERAGEVWVFSGDYKTEADAATCAAFEPVRCHTFITESTFGLPVYRWRPQEELRAEINAWWRANAEEGRASLLFGYSLGKAQRLLAALDPETGPILVHGAVEPFLEPYRAAGVRLPHCERATAERVKAARGRCIAIAPPSAGGSPWARKFGDASRASASGWMQLRGSRRRQALERGFPLSDHADWPGLLSAIGATGATRVGVTHGCAETLARYLREERSLDAFVLSTRFEGEMDDTPPEPEPAP
jgi:putative mRNA 3-end processing factor